MVELFGPWSSIFFRVELELFGPWSSSREGAGTRPLVFNLRGKQSSTSSLYFLLGKCLSFFSTSFIFPVTCTSNRHNFNLHNSSKQHYFFYFYNLRTYDNYTKQINLLLKIPMRMNSVAKLWYDYIH